MKALGIDIGASSIKAVHFDSSKIKSFFLKSPQTKKDFEKLAKNLILENGGKSLDKIGFGVPGQINHEKLIARNVPNLKYLTGFDFGKFVRSLHLGALDIKIDNDVNCHMNAEAKFGHAKGLKNAVMIAIGTGIGGSIIIDGKFYRGKSGSAGEIGWTVLDKGQVFGSLAGGQTLRRFNKQELERVRHYTAIACANVINILNPEAVILTGGVIHSNSIVPAVRKLMRKYIIDPDAKRTKVLVAEMGEFGAAVGAAWL